MSRPQKKLMYVCGEIPLDPRECANDVCIHMITPRFSIGRTKHIHNK